MILLVLEALALFDGGFLEEFEIERKEVMNVEF